MMNALLNTKLKQKRYTKQHISKSFEDVAPTPHHDVSALIPISVHAWLIPTPDNSRHILINSLMLINQDKKSQLEKKNYIFKPSSHNPPINWNIIMGGNPINYTVPLHYPVYLSSFF